MKKLMIIFFPVFLISCQKSDLEFSCDPVINSFIIDHREDLAKLTVNELTSYELKMQKAIFNSWDYNKKRCAWIDKIQYVLFHMSFTDQEKAHIQILISHIDENYFLKENIEKYLEIRNSFADEWMNSSFNELGWSKQFVSFMVNSLFLDQSQFASELSMLKSIRATIKTNSEEGDCDCNISSDFCFESACRSVPCRITSGCGWLWSMPCDGSCLISL